MSSVATAVAAPVPAVARPISRPHDAAEQQADRAAETVAQGRSVAGWSFVGAPPAAPRADIEAALATPGRPLEPVTQAAMARRFGYDFSRVRVHDGGCAAVAASGLGAAAFTVGEQIVFGASRYRPASREGRRLIAHELAHVVQQARAPLPGPSPIQRKVIVNGAELDAKERAAFLKRHTWRNGALAKEILDDMADAGDPFDFTDEAELTTEIVKRASTVTHMRESQQAVGSDNRRAFAYPFNPRNGTQLYGPRVNHAARDLWEPRPPDDYAPRTDAKKNAALLTLPRSRAHEIYGDMDGDYEWTLTGAGTKDVFSAIALLFTPQATPRLRTLLHCDYLISLVNFRSLADSLGKDEFNKRIAGFTLLHQIRLRWNAFTDLHATVEELFHVPVIGDLTLTLPGLGSTQRMQPSTERDLVIGDHVVFFNNLAYDLINAPIGNAWRLENAVLIKRGRTPAEDVFEGHGSGQMTAAAMRDKLASEFNEVENKAEKLTKLAASKDKKTADNAHDVLAQMSVVERSDGWHVAGTPDLCSTKTVDQKLRPIRPDEVIGLHDPCNLAQMSAVERPIESAKGKP